MGLSNINPIASVAEGVVKGVGGVLDDLFTSDEERGKIQVALEKIKNAPFMASLQVLAKEAEHTSVFVAGARPALLWAVVGGIAYEGLLRGLMIWLQSWAIIVLEYSGPVPTLPTLETVFFELCGLAAALYGVRGWEKKNGTARNNMGSRNTDDIS